MVVVKKVILKCNLSKTLYGRMAQMILHTSVEGNVSYPKIFYTKKKFTNAKMTENVENLLEKLKAF